MTAKIDGTSGLLQQYDYQVSTTGFSYTFAAGTTVLVMNPAGTLATGTITMPAAPADGMTISFSSTQIITALTVSANTGQSIVGQPTTMLAGGAASFVYRLSNTTWYAQLNTAAIGGAPVVTIYSSPSPWTKSASLKAVKVTMVGGGAGGGGGAVGSSGSGGGGGGNGGYIQGYAQAPAIPGPVTVTVGAGGGGGGPAPSNGSTGTSGGTTSFGAVFSTTGGAGGPGASSGTPGAQAPGASGGSFAITSTPTSSSIQIQNPVAIGAIQAFGIHGASSALPSTAPGSVGQGYGMGGGGASNSGTGGAGTAGFVIVEEFY
jgi:hypothetical protein